MNPEKGVVVTFDALLTWMIVILLAVVFPLLGVRDFRILVRRTREGDADARVKFYKGIFIWYWPLTIGFLAWWFMSGNTPASIGLAPVVEGPQWFAIGIGVMVIASQLVALTLGSRDNDKLTAIKEQMGEISNLIPQTRSEDRLFDMVSITAGICEEVLYRGFLLVTLESLVGIWPAVVLSSLIFGLGHAYQGLTGIVKTGCVGLILALLTVFSGSLFIAMALHTVLDMTSGRLMGRALRMTPQPA